MPAAKGVAQDILSENLPRYEHCTQVFLDTDSHMENSHGPDWSDLDILQR